ncbi:N-methylglutamate dehydrogenase subunit C [Arboricoccus pini]|uniref:N-methylglutamate dehydrogenase subunit C n=1 Tax=Arboricoccus pini TaxID=1963835 RepID=A0A212RP27_9PROT|nr:sarcosine oxidase subunit alpha family protein [Arboricoccus pini]SNB74186.1 N-methylglutamate dehydrogenase subunit C [Arboricoccus pini]
MPRQRRPGTGIDPAQKLDFQFDGLPLQGVAGDTLAAALLANGVRVVGRSFKYHRARGIVTAGPEEPNALVELREGARLEPNTKATTVELFDGLSARSQNRWPSLGLDLMAVNQLASPLLAAGFYYKTFMWPRHFWEKLYEPAIRRAAGLGRASGLPDPDSYEKCYAHADLLVVGAGPAGLIAALLAARSGARVILAEEDFLLGGRLLAEAFLIDDAPAHLWARRVEAELETLPNVRILKRTAVFGAYDDGTFGAIEKVADHLPEPEPGQVRQRYWQIVAARAVLATGGIERGIAFGGNDRPGVMLASAVRTYLHRFGVAAASRIAVFTSSDDGWKTAFDLAAAGIEVPFLADARADVAADLVERGRRLGLRVELGARVEDATGATGLNGAYLRSARGTTWLPIEALAVSGGWNSNLGLSTHLGGKPEWSETAAAFLPGKTPSWMRVAGAAAGAFGLGEAFRGGVEAALAVLGELERRVPAFDMPIASDDPARTTPLWRVEGASGKAFVDLQHDVTVKDVELAHREGFKAVEHLKRYTTLGMATDQGKSMAILGQAIMADLEKVGPAGLGTTRARPPQVPVAIGALAGRHRGRQFRPTRLTASHDWAAAAAAPFMDAGLWKRAQYFARPGETNWRQAVDREVLTVRAHVGVADVSTLGKIAVLGPDAGIFLDKVYVNGFSGLAVGKVRYGLMLREDGFVMDDGTAARLGDTDYLVSTTTANAANVMMHLEYCHQVLWPQLDVRMASVTEQWAQFAVAGPKARALLSGILPSTPLENGDLPHMGCRPIEIGGVRGRLFRLSFSGELAFELAVPARFGAALWRSLVHAAETLGGSAYGSEALGVMRIEKGHVGGAELNGRTTAFDLGLGRLLSRKKDFIGRVMAARPALNDLHRMRLVGLVPLDGRAKLPVGAHLVPEGERPAASVDQGYVTSAAYSPTLGHPIALALLSGGPERLGQTIRVVDPLRDGDALARIVAPVFVDPEGSRVLA